MKRLKRLIVQLPGRHVEFILPVLMLVLSLSCTYLLWHRAELAAQGTLEKEFDFRVRDLSTRILRRVGTYEQVLRGQRGFLRGSVDVDREQFRHYVETLDLGSYYPGIQGLGIARLIARENKETHVSRMRAQGFPHYDVSPAGERAVYTSVTHLEPFNQMNARAFGYDMFSEPVRRAAMAQARDTGKAAVTGKVILVQESGQQKQFGFLMYLPVYRNGLPTETVAQRRAALVGWVYAPFRINDFMDGLNGERSSELVINIYDGTTTADDARLYQAGIDDDLFSLFHTRQRLEIAGRPWTLDVTSSPAMEARLDESNAKLIATGGMLTSLLLALIVWTLASSRKRALSLAIGMTSRLRESELRWKYALEGAGDGVWDLDVQTGKVVYSRRWKEMLGYHDHEIANTIDVWEQLVHPLDKAATLAELADCIEGWSSSFSREFRMCCKDGGWKWVHSRATVVSYSAGGKPSRIIGTHADITQRKEQEEREAQHQKTLEETRTALLHSQKLEAIGKLTGGVAHDFNNVLQIISGNLQLLLAGSHAQADNARMHNALAAVDRGAKLSAQLLAFARRQPLVPMVVNLGKLVRNMDDMVRRALSDSIHLQTAIAEDVWNTLVDPGQLENVLINLVINARDAMPAGGNLTIEVSNTHLDEHSTRRHLDLKPGPYVTLAVSDSGEGMSDDVIERAIEPFFTTKPNGQGTGLGLSMAYGFVKQSGGHMRIDSQIGHGTTVRIYLPRSFEDEDRIQEELDRPVVGGSETILVVEDDLQVQASVVATLDGLGYQVLKASDAERALSILKSGIPVDLLFTDVVMPGRLKSTEMAKQAKALLPGLAVLFTSGYTQDAMMQGGRLDPGVQLLSKPYRREQLARKVRHVLANQQQVAHARQALRDTRAEALANAPAGAALAARGSRLRILLVEDNDDLREMAGELLSILGHKAATASSAEQALAMLPQGHYDVLFTDVGLPGMDGVDLARQAVQAMPDLKVIFATGYGDSLEAPDELHASVLTKPYDLFHMQQALLARAG